MKTTKSQEAIAAAQQIAAALVGDLACRKGWRARELEFDLPHKADEQYGLINVVSFGERIDFAIWIDRTRSRLRDDVPILCAAFGVDGKKDGDWLTYLAKTEGVRRQPYHYDQEDRLIGFDHQPVLDEPSNVGRFLSSYRAAGRYEIAPAIRQFRRFWDLWAPKVEPLAHAPHRAKPLRSDWSGRAVRGVVGELAVLAQPACRKATWVGMHTEPYDIQNGRDLIEVKTRSDETVTVSRGQIEAGENDRYFVAIVELPPHARLALSGAIEGDKKLHPVVARYKEEILEYLRRRGVTVDKALYAAISCAVRLSLDAVSMHRLEAPPGFYDALDAVEQFGRIADLSIACGNEWFKPAEI